MTELPKITIAMRPGGWLAQCECGWLLFHMRRPPADLAAVKHRAAHQKRTKDQW